MYLWELNDLWAIFCLRPTLGSSLGKSAPETSYDGGGPQLLDQFICFSRRTQTNRPGIIHFPKTDLIMCSFVYLYIFKIYERVCEIGFS